MIVVVTPYERLTQTHIDKLLDIETYIDGVILRTPTEQDMLVNWIETLLRAGFPKSKVIVHTDVTLAERMGIQQLHFREGDMTAFALKAQKPSYQVSMSAHSVESIVTARDRQLDFGVYGHLFMSASKPGQAPRTKDAIQQALSQHWPLVAIGGIDVASVKEVAPQFSGIACIQSAFATSTSTFKEMVQHWQQLKKERMP
ncbi:hypothetical protein TP70_05995 [Staphylococcus microti]|uniref:Thiamine monophosphate synthase n=1 Tax=Staphylococcus microti TaxID=569857 RepID=A0A0D6XQE8_9STAP|nr:thiamine phosphate synthase [Staphylococcus microti]KIX90670.1 hypothetical protein TP70_05995 [Staphylococcus microti]PNZ81769.1 thiamine phosphate synthase [Staphylococcus microti]SUM56751.1 thiamine monophosphate synthase [Staphylococcus microti]